MWPILFAGCVMLAGRGRRHLGRTLAICFLLVLAGSFWFNVHLTNEANPWAFFSLPTRAWEFAAAGLLAVLSTRLVVRPVVVRGLIGGAGIVMIGVAALRFTADTPFPGVAALVPVIGTMLVIVAGMDVDDSTSSPMTAVLATAPLQWIGRVSYSWYLWHWPFIVLAVATYDDRVRYRLLAAAISLPVAYLTYRVVENPIRFSRRLAASIPRTYLLGAIATVAGVAVGLGVAFANSGPPPQMTLDAKLAAATTHEKGCSSASTPGGITYCEGGDVTSDTVVLFIGDSHAEVWRDAMGQAARSLGVRLVSRALPGCPPIPLEVQPRRRGLAESEACARKRADDARFLTEMRPAAVILGDV